MTPRLTAAAAGLIAAAVAIGAWQAGLLRAPERALLDARFTVRGAERPPRSVVIVALDEDSLARLPQPPLPRRLYAQLIDQLDRAGARLIVFDIAFDRPTPQDPVLRAAARRAAPVLFGTAQIDQAGNTLVLGGPAAQRQIHARVGGTLLPADPDGAVRRVPYAVKGLPSLAVTAGGMLGAHPPRARFGRSGALIDYAGGRGTFPALSLSSVLAGRVAPARFAGKTVLVGATAPSFQDLHPTPSGVMAGVEIQANALRTVLAGVPLRRSSDLVTVLLTLLLAFAAPLASLRLPLAAALGAALLAAAAYAVASQVSFGHGRVLDVSTPLLASLVSAGATLTLGYIGANRERRRLREQFAAFSPEVVDAVLEGSATAPLAATAIVGGYRVEEVIGRGGMAVVYRATQLLLGRPVALKLITPDFARDPVFRERFLNESRAAAAVEHPNVIPVYEAGDDDSLLFIAMRYVDGVDLEAVLTRLGPLAPADAVRIVSQLAGALDAAHAKGLVHRDVKPSNVLLAGELEHAYLTDFGIARAVGSTSGLTSAGSFIGSPDYAAPEQILGGEIDGRADVYALGALLFRSLTGRVPYLRDSPLATLHAHLDEPVPAASLDDPALVAFDAVIAHALAKQAADRPPTAGALAAEARAALG